MAKATLATNFKDDILNSSMGNKRRYNLIQNSDGTVSLEDVSTYDQIGSEYGAGQVNATNKAVNESADAGKIIDDVDDIEAVTEGGYIAGALALKSVNDSLQADNGQGFNFSYDSESGKYGYTVTDSEGADTFCPFSGNIELSSIAARTHGAVASLFYYQFILDDISKFNYLLVVLFSISDISDSSDQSIRSISDGTLTKILSKTITGNSSANSSLGIYLIKNPTNGMTINTYTNAAGYECVYGF